MTKPKVTIAVVCFNERENIVPCLKSLLNQSYRSQDYEILVIDNESTDNTVRLVKQLQRKSKRIRLVINPKKGIAISRNVALRKARGELLAFTDADCLVPKNWLIELVKGYLKYKSKNSAVVAVGGPNFPPKTTPFYQALGLMLASSLGGRDTVQTKRYLKDRYVLHLPTVNVLYEKKKLREINGFDKSFGSIIEDEDMSFRLSQKGYQFVYLAKAGLIHKMRDNPWAWAKNMFVYGKGRMWFLKKYPQKIDLIFLLPIVLVLTTPFSLPIYLPIIFLYSAWVTIRAKRIGLLPQVFSLYIATHLAYGLGEIYGIFKRRG